MSKSPYELLFKRRVRAITDSSSPSVLVNFLCLDFQSLLFILSSGIVNNVPARPTTKKKKSPKIALLPIAPKFGPQEVNRFSSLCAQFQPPGSFELYAAIFSNLVKMAVHSGRILLLVLRRIKVCIDEFRPNTSKLL